MYLILLEYMNFFISQLRHRINHITIIKQANIQLKSGLTRNNINKPNLLTKARKRRYCPYMCKYA